MKFPSKEQVDMVRQTYRKGARVELVTMSDPHTALKPGDRGTVDFVDDTGTVFCDWDSGSTLGAVFGVDEIRLLTKAEVIKEQCRKVAQTGRTNMFDTEAALGITLEMGLSELADLIITDAKAYSKLILTGDIEGDRL